MLEEAEWTPPDEFDEYRIVRQLGRGSMGSVYLAHDIVLDRSVAMKFLGALRPDPIERERFLVEARAVARILHPNVMSIFRVGEIKGRLYLVTEYVRGENLADLELPIPWTRALEVGIGLARGLAAAHRQGVLHRDLKLSNAVIDEGGQVKLLDFGLAKLVDVGDRAESSSPSHARERTEDPVALAGKNALTMAASRISDTLRAEQTDATAPTPKLKERREATPRLVTTSGDTGDGEDLRTRRERFGAWNRSGASITRVGTVMGTPHYMAPELWLADPASRRSDVYALGVVLYILVAGRPPHDAETPFELAMEVQENDPPPLIDVAPACDPRLAAIIDRCLHRDPYERFAAGDELRTALEMLQMPARARGGKVPTGNPYRGLQAFEAEHRSLFFGRTAEVRSVVERLRTDSFVVVAGDSGVGKSSLCRAGVIPSVLEGELDPSKTWRSVTMTPGRYPRHSFVSVIARGFGLGEDEVSELLGREPEALVRALRKQLGESGGCLIFLDQFEEFVTISEPAEAEVIGPMIVRLLAGIPGLKVLATVRGDFLTRAVTVPGLGEEVARGVFLLRPLSPEGAREAIVGPAQVHGVAFESDELVDELVEAGVRGSLPLLQFALAELWESRDQSTSVISAGELRKIGGVTGALARHADGVIASLLPNQRTAARRLLMRLVTLDNTRASLTEEELVASDEASKAALDALVRGRLLVIKEAGERMVYEIAHEALVGGWNQLAGWLDEEKEARAVRFRLEQAAVEWERLGKGREGLWSAAQVVEARVLEAESLREREREFLSSSTANAARSRLLRRVAIASVPLLIGLTYAGTSLRSARELQRRVEAQVAEASEVLGEGKRKAQERASKKAEAFSRFDSKDMEGGEKAWAEVATMTRDLSRLFVRASDLAERTLSLDNESREARQVIAEVLFERALLAEDLGDPTAFTEYSSRLALYDEGGAIARRLDGATSLSIRAGDASATVSLLRYEDEDGRLVLADPVELGAAPTPSRPLDPGSYLALLTDAGGNETRYPIMLRRGEERQVDVLLPRPELIPSGFVFVPPGPFAFGYAGDNEFRNALHHTAPLHEVSTGPFLIARNELTFGEYLEWVATLPEEEKTKRLPNDGEIVSVSASDSGWKISWAAEEGPHEAVSGAPLVFPKREEHREMEWGSLPVSGVSAEDVAAYAAWLAASGRVPNARLCSDLEWERAARGADGRLFPHGDRLAPADANFDETYGKDAQKMGPEPVGSRPASRSPFGADDMAGNVYEWVVSSLGDSDHVIRGGCFLHLEMTSRSVHRELLGSNLRSAMIGARICADVEL
ncbi:MAG: SUMF1/EgtB/PvdO family nonheme iron enzyme [Myxococcales bacterium]|nr:SUMF1/EgtB/PvdO family nonheme iron enzyme [Myxococcales bacterium]